MKSKFTSVPMILKFGYGLSTRSMFFLPIIFLYYQTKNIEMGDFFLLQSINTVMIFIAEIPTGYISDNFDRKKVMLWAVITWFVGCLFMLFGQTFTVLIGGELFSGIGLALFSGTREAYLYDYLISEGREKDALKEEGMMYSCEQWFLLFSSVAGALLYSYNIHYPMYACLVFTVVAFCSMCFLPRVQISKKVCDKRNVLQDLKDTIHYSLKGHHEIKWIILYSATMFVGMALLFWCLQPQLRDFGVAVKYFGLFLACNYLLKGVLSANAERVSNKIGLKNCLMIFLCLIVIACFAVYTSYSYFNESYMVYVFILISLLTIAFVHGVGRPIFVTLINRRVESYRRATVLSVSAFVYNGFHATVFFAMKFLIDGIGLYNSMLIFAGLFLFGVIPLVKLLRIKW